MKSRRPGQPRLSLQWPLVWTWIRLASAALIVLAVLGARSWGHHPAGAQEATNVLDGREWAIRIDPVRCPLPGLHRQGVVTVPTGYPLCLADLPAPLEPIDPAGFWWRIRFADALTAGDRIVRLAARPGVLTIEPAVHLTYQWLPSDPEISAQSWLMVTGFPDAWNDSIGRRELVVAVIDSGVVHDHPDLAGKLLPGYDFLRHDDDPDDEVGHGTAVAGIIAAAGGNGVGIAGGAMGVRILPLKVGDQFGASSFLIAQAIYAAVESGARVINLSLGADTPSATLEQAIEWAYERETVVVAAAGNSPDTVTFPASYPEVIAVGGATADGRRLASFSSRLTRVDLVAPAENVLTTTWDGQHAGWEPRSGTSFATPIVTATVALVRSIAPDSRVEWVRQVLRETARPLDPPGQPGAGAGLVSASGAVHRAVLRRFAQAWQRDDLPVAAGVSERSWVWGPQAFAVGREPYEGTRSGTRAVAYFDKARLELTDPDRPPEDPWSVTTGLLARELISGLMQVGDASFVQRAPATVPVAGDPDDTTGPTYASLAGLLNAPPLSENALIVQVVDRQGRVTENALLAAYDVRAGPLIQETGHRIATVFWEFLQRQGTVYEGGRFREGRLFWPDFAVTGFPITEAYWARVKVAGQERDVLIQCFERRCLTYTPDNPPDWQVELGNVGQHYYRWRYVSLPPAPPPDDPTALAPVESSDGRG